MNVDTPKIMSRHGGDVITAECLYVIWIRGMRTVCLRAAVLTRYYHLARSNRLGSLGDKLR